MDKLVSPAIIENYNKTRAPGVTHLLCHAPSVSINFEQNGNMTACCYNRKHVLGTYPTTTIMDAWRGQKANELREYIKKNDLGGGCSACAEALNSGNFNGSKAKYYDEYAYPPAGLFDVFKKLNPPKVFEFEIANTCNLECIMCSGYFSSSIRKNREKLPLQHNPYDDNFVDQVVEFLPGITDLKYLGGEPFQIEIYLKIWEKVAKVNPAIRNHITTNGTILNARVKGLIEDLRCGIILSIDSVRKDTYEKIRQGADFDKVMANLDYFMEYAKKKKTYLSMTICPITTNAEEMPEIVRFANQRNIRVHFNIVWTPDHLSLRFADEERLESLIEMYSEDGNPRNELEASNYNKLKEYAGQLQFWYDERLKNEMEMSHDPLPGTIQIPEDAALLTRNVLEHIVQHFNHETAESDYHSSLSDAMRNTNAIDFIDSYLDAITIIQRNMAGDKEIFQEKIEAMKKIARTVPNKELMATELVYTGVLYQINYIGQQSYEQITGSIVSRYN